MHSLRLDELTSGILQPTNFSVAAGQCLALHGRSGSGKTRLLRAIADLDKNSGEVWLDGTARSTMPPPVWRRKVMYFPAESHWWSDLVGPHLPDWDQELLARLGLPTGVLDWEISRLSSGERQRLGLARGLSVRPEVLLLDEPTANLDTENAHGVEEAILGYIDTHQAPAIWVTHDPAQRTRIGNLVGELVEGNVQLATLEWT